MDRFSGSNEETKNIASTSPADEVKDKKRILTDPFFGLDKEAKENEDVALLTTVHDEVEKNLLCGMLEEEEIPYLAKDRGAGEVNRIFFGYSMYDCDIMVPRALLEKARELLNAFGDAEGFADDEIVTDPDEEGEEA